MNDQRSTSRRRQQLLALLRSSEFVRVPELSLRFGVSKVTIRNDLDVLAKRGQVVRVPGGAIPNASPSERAFEARQAVASDAKTAIGEAAVDLISPGNTIILDVGTTTMAIARALVSRSELRGVVVFTNALNIALALEAAIPRIEVFVTGGALRPIQHSLVEAAQQVVIVADGSKFLREAMTRVCGLEELDFILTAGELAPDVLPAFADTGVDIRAVPAIGTGSGEAELGS